MGTHTTRPLLFLLVMIITMQFLFCGIYYPNRENYVVKINYGDNVNKGDPDVVSKERGYLLQTLGDKEVHNWLYAINPLLAGQLRLAVPVKVDETVRMNTSEHHTVKNIIKRQLKCPEIPSGLGLSHVKLFHLHPITIEYSNVKKGGISKSYGCKPQQKAAVIVAVEPGWSKTALNTFLYYLHTFLRKQQLDYQMFVVQQGNSSQGFSRGKLLNAAFTEIHRRNATIRFPCIIFHDPHILPLDTRNLYRCTWNPKQLAVEIMTNDRKIYKPTFGGAVALTFEQFITVNGFSSDSLNNFEFHGIYKRLISRNYTIERSPELFGKYVIPKIFDQHAIPFESVNASTLSTEMEGLANLIYDVVKFEIRNMYTFLQIDFPDESKETAVTFTAPWDEMTSIKEIPAEFESLSNYTFSLKMLRVYNAKQCAKKDINTKNKKTGQVHSHFRMLRIYP